MDILLLWKENMDKYFNFIHKYGLISMSQDRWIIDKYA